MKNLVCLYFYGKVGEATQGDCQNGEKLLKAYTQISYRYLKAILASIILESYNVVGDGTMAQIIPMLTGNN